MPLFGRRSGPDDEARRAAQAEQEASIMALAAGGLPLRAQRRLREASAAVPTSDLSVNELALAAREGIRPVAQVMGSSVYHVGWQRMPGGWGWQGVTQELTVLSDAWNEARRLAFGRLQQEAELAGAHTVVGLDLKIGSHDWMAGAVEYVVFGTAVRVEDGDGSRAVLTNLSLQDYWLLRREGYRPVGVCGASGVFYVVSSWQQQRVQSGWGSWANQELREFTQGVYDAREVTIGRLSQQAREQGANGLVGVSLVHDVHLREVEQQGSNRLDLIVTMHALGTAIRAEGAAGWEPPRLAVDVSRDRATNHLLGGAQ